MEKKIKAPSYNFEQFWCERVCTLCQAFESSARKSRSGGGTGNRGQQRCHKRAAARQLTTEGPACALQLQACSGSRCND
jgi:hypothetical protein